MVGQWVQSAARPLWKAGGIVSGEWSAFREAFQNRSDLASENRALRRQIEAMSLKLLDRNLLREENAALREKLGREVSEELKVVAEVLAGPGRVAYDTLVLDVGTRSGVSAGDTVLYEDTVAVGTISQVFRTTSKAILFSSPGQEVAVLVGDGRIPTKAIGRGGGNFQVSLPRDAHVSVGEPIVAPGTQPRIVGVIEHIEAAPNKPFKIILFKSPVNIFDIRWVEVIKKET